MKKEESGNKVSKNITFILIREMLKNKLCEVVCNAVDEAFLSKQKKKKHKKREVKEK